MSHLIFIKLGGSLITDKRVVAGYRSDAVNTVGLVLREVLTKRPDLRILLGHGSGSFGHSVARRHGTREGVWDEAGWRGFAEVASAAAQLNQLVRDDLLACQLPVMSLQPSASVICEGGKLVHYDWVTVRECMTRGLIPLVYGDVALDSRLGGTITSTEEIFAYLVAPLTPARILLLGEVTGVHNGAGAIIPEITPQNIHLHRHDLGGSAAADVTGGMLSKVQEMLTLVERHPALEVRILTGDDPEALRLALMGESTAKVGTRIAYA